MASSDKCRDVVVQSALLNEDDPLAQRTDGLLLCSVRDEGFAVSALRRACHEVENGLDSRTKYSMYIAALN